MSNGTTKDFSVAGQKWNYENKDENNFKSEE